MGALLPNAKQRKQIADYAHAFGMRIPLELIALAETTEIGQSEPHRLDCAVPGALHESPWIALTSLPPLKVVRAVIFGFSARNSA